MPSLAGDPPRYVRNRPGKIKYNTIAAILQTMRARMRPPIGGTTVTSEKAVDGVIFVVEQARTKEKTLAFFSMWIKRKN